MRAGFTAIGIYGYLSDLTQGKMNVTIGSALDIFGGKLKWDKVLEMCKVHKNYADISED